MKLIKPYTVILTELSGSKVLKDIEAVARTCYKSEEKISEDDSSARELVNKLMKRGHEAMLEFGGDITVKFVCDRGVSHEIVRHRLASFAQESTRYCNYTNEKFDGEVTFIIPSWVDIEEGSWSQARLFEDLSFRPDHSVTVDAWASFMFDSELTYKELIEAGWSPQQARSVLPNSLKTEINVKMNIREWRHFFKLRCSNAAHPQMQELTRPLLAEFQAKIPVLFDDITY
jgi:thymidylate synthase (FAD)